ncbi:MAG: hypoxanthine phosphoribosyltransferase [Paludibacteraceae bacterium]|nr:hypoxanthine phosphoribosyltransferase [Paludibacteraceae bacterium]
MKSIRILDRTFCPFIDSEEIQRAVCRVADEINHDLEGQDPLFVSILNGSFMFAADLMKHVSIPCEITFWKLSSYSGTSSTGQINEQMPLLQSVRDRNVVIVEDIVDTGYTMQHILEAMQREGARSVRICTFFQKPEALKVKDLKVDYVAIKIPNAFIVGYGLDYDGYGRNLPDVYQVEA